MKLVHQLSLISVLLLGPIWMVQANQPHMKEALESLARAKESLQQASHDKGGHRARAIQAINEAMAEVKAGMTFDREHSSARERSH